MVRLGPGGCEKGDCVNPALTLLSAVTDSSLCRPNLFAWLGIQVVGGLRPRRPFGEVRI